MARFRQQRRNRYALLRSEHFTPLEARELSKLPRNTPALKQMRDDRVARRERFDRIAARKLEQGRWRKSDVAGKWLKNLSRLYSKRGWRVKRGATGDQQKMPKRGANPWAAYRDYIKDTPDKGYTSPWQLRKVRMLRTLDQVKVLDQQRERRGVVSPLSRDTLVNWIDQLGQSIKQATGSRRAQLVEQKERLERLV